MSAEPGNEGKVETEDILEPLDSGCGFVGQDFDEFGASEVTR